MKFFNKKFLLFLLLTACIVTMTVVLTACGMYGEQPGQTDDGGDDGSDITWTIQKAYASAQEEGFDGTLQEFLESLTTISDIELNSDGELVFTLNDGTDVNVGKVQGPAGETGATGPAGTDGADGATGPAGADGADGNGIAKITKRTNGNVDTYTIEFTDTAEEDFVFTVTNGVDGADGADGEDGADGVDGAQGPKGDTGEQGPAGPQGPQGETGATGPAGADGEDGADGVDGAQGPKGDTGEQGPAGPQGPQGETGPAGPTGPAGADGEDGADGVDGAQGPKGDTGEQGPAGPQGPQGETGATGANGADGADGASTYIAYSVNADGTDYTLTWSIGQNYIGICSSTTAPDDKTDYVWSRYIQSETAFMTVAYDGTKTYFSSLSEALESANGIAVGKYTAQQVNVLSGTVVIPEGETINIGKFVTLNVFPSAEIINRGTINFISPSSSSSANSFYLDGTLINYGTISMPKYNKMYANANSSIINDGIINMGDTSTKSWSYLYIYEGATLNNYATIVSSGTIDVYGTIRERVAGSGITSYGSLYVRDGGDLNAEQGTININAGTMKLFSGSKFNLPTTSLLTIAEGATFTVEDAVSFASSSFAKTVNNGTATAEIDSYDDFKSFLYFDKISMKLVNDIQYSTYSGVSDVTINCANYNVTFTLDLNGFDFKNELNINAKKNATTPYDNAFNVTIKDTSAGEKGTIGCYDNATVYSSDTACNYGIMVEGFDNVSLTLDNVNLKGRIAGLYTNGTYGGTSTITATNCTFAGNPDNSDAGAYLASNFTYSFTDCTFAGETGLYVKAGEYMIINCTFTANGIHNEPSYNGNGANLTGDAFVIDSCEAIAEANRRLNVTIAGGTFSCSEGCHDIAVVQTYSTTQVDYAKLNGAESTVFYADDGVEVLTDINNGYFDLSSEGKWTEWVLG